MCQRDLLTLTWQMICNIHYHFCLYKQNKKVSKKAKNWLNAITSPCNLSKFKCHKSRMFSFLGPIFHFVWESHQLSNNLPITSLEIPTTTSFHEQIFTTLFWIMCVLGTSPYKIRYFLLGYVYHHAKVNASLLGIV